MDEKVKTQTIIIGEASESDDECEEPAAFTNRGEMSRNSLDVAPFLPSSDHPQFPEKQDTPHLPPKAAEEEGRITGKLVSGEASESDTDDEINNSVTPTIDTSASLQLSPPLKVEGFGASSTSNQLMSPDRSPKYDSLLHKKLKETNDRLKKDVEIFKSKPYEMAIKDLRNISQQLSKSQAATKEMKDSMRLVCNDLFHLEDKLDIITSCTLIPDIDASLLPKNIRTPATLHSIQHSLSTAT